MCDVKNTKNNLKKKVKKKENHKIWGPSEDDWGPTEGMATIWQTMQSGFRSQRRIQSVFPQASTFERVNSPFPQLFVVIGDVNIVSLFTLF